MHEEEVEKPKAGDKSKKLRKEQPKISRNVMLALAKQTNTEVTDLKAS